jgi:hypothetical protein
VHAPEVGRPASSPDQHLAHLAGSSDIHRNHVPIGFQLPDVLGAKEVVDGVRKRDGDRHWRNAFGLLECSLHDLDGQPVGRFAAERRSAPEGLGLVPGSLCLAQLAVPRAAGKPVGKIGGERHRATAP